MAYTSLVSPTIDGAYSFIPLQIQDTTASATTAYQYLVNIGWNKNNISTAVAIQYGGVIYTKVNFTLSHPYALGDTIFLRQSPSDTYSGYYTVLSVPSSNSIIINMPFEQSITGTTTVNNVIKYKLSPLPTGDIKLDLSNTIKNLVSQNLEDVNDVFDGSNTKFKYNIQCGAEYQEIFSFYDNTVCASGNAGFVSTAITQTNQTKFKIGDDILIKQNLFEIPYTLTGADANGYLYVVSTIDYSSSFARGSFNLDVSGQDAYPDNNGPTTSAANTYPQWINTNKKTTLPAGTHITDGGILYANITPEFDRVATIVNIYKQTSAPYGIVIETDIPFNFTSPRVSGVIKTSSTQYQTKWDGPSIDAVAYNQFTSTNDYSAKGNASDYTFTSSAEVGGFATILPRCTQATKTLPQNQTRIELSSKSWLLVHTENGRVGAILYTLYNSNNIALGSFALNNGLYNNKDWYAPVGLNYVNAAPGLIDNSVSMHSIIGQTTWYTVQGISDTDTQIPWGKTVAYKINDDCSIYELYHLMWKDAKGSWISYPFKYVSTPSTEVSRANYYKNNGGNWGSQTFGFDTFSKGESTFFAKSRDKIVLNSGFITQAENAIIMDLLKSAAVYLQLPSGKLVAAQIKTNELPAPNFVDNLIQYTIPVSYANDDRRY